MASSTPDLLFRVWNDRSTGTNSSSSFQPASSINDTPPHLRGEVLRNSLLRYDANSPFTFFTDSLLYAIVFAGFREDQGAKDLQLTCIDTRWATTSTGERPNFIRVNDLMRTWGVELRNRKDDSLRTYTGEWISTNPVILGAGSCTVAIDTLVQRGLYDFHPALEEVRNYSEKGPKLYVAVSMLRQFGFARVSKLTEEKLNAAASLVAAFQPCLHWHSIAGTQGQLMAWMLSLGKRNVADDLPRAWIASRTELELSEQRSQVAVACCPRQHPDMPEVDQYLQLAPLFSRSLQMTFPQGARTGPESVHAGKAEWRAWLTRNREVHRAATAARRNAAEVEHKSLRAKVSQRRRRHMSGQRNEMRSYGAHRREGRNHCQRSRNREYVYRKNLSRRTEKVVD